MTFALRKREGWVRKSFVPERRWAKILVPAKRAWRSLGARSQGVLECMF